MADCCSIDICDDHSVHANDIISNTKNKPTAYLNENYRKILLAQLMQKELNLLFHPIVLKHLMKIPK